jgi:uncharacterized damage-inducible protein DinB
MTPDQANFLLQEVCLPQIRNEFKTTRKVIEAVPDEKSSYQPDPKCMTAWQLASHIAGSECFFIHGVAHGAFDFSYGKIPESITTIGDLLQWYDEKFTAAFDALAQAKPEDLVKNIDFRGVFNLPAINYVSLMTSHSIHHRGQLSAYLRPMGAKVPRIYGGSADEPIEVPARA